MKRYCLLQCKRIARYLPGALLAMLVLFGGLMTVFSAAMRQDTASDKKFQVAMVGTADDMMLQMGLTALKTFDSTQFAMEIVEMTEEEARAALEKGSISAYLVFPEGFMDEALGGHILPVKFVSTTGAAGVVSVFKEEVTKVISRLLLDSQRGVFGMQDAMGDLDVPYNGRLDILAFTFVDYILARDNLYTLDEMGISNALGLEDYLLCGLFLLFLMLACLPFAPLMIRRDMALDRMLSARGCGVPAQTLCDLGIYMAGFCLLVAVLKIPAAFLAPQLKLELIPMLPVIFTVCSLSFLLYTLCADLISGVLVQFFTTLALCFVSGCMYPIFFFPLSVQKLAGWLPTGVARSQLTACLTGEGYDRVWLLWVYGLVFTAISVLARLRRVKEARV